MLDVKDFITRQSLLDFQNVEHRLEHVINVHGIEFINDSKATNINSVMVCFIKYIKIQFGLLEV